MYLRIQEVSTIQVKIVVAVISHIVLGNLIPRALIMLILTSVFLVTLIRQKVSMELRVVLILLLVGGQNVLIAIRGCVLGTLTRNNFLGRVSRYILILIESWQLPPTQFAGPNGNMALEFLDTKNYL